MHVFFISNRFILPEVTSMTNDTTQWNNVSTPIHFNFREICSIYDFNDNTKEIFTTNELQTFVVQNYRRSYIDDNCGGGTILYAENATLNKNNYSKKYLFCQFR